MAEKTNTIPSAQPKGILKKEKQTSKSSKKLVWDEDNISEAEKLRGTRMKIDEPKTPFRRQSFSDDDMFEEPDDEPVAEADFACQLKTALEGDQQEDPEKNEKDRSEFLKKRKAHYNEFHKLKQLRQQQPHLLQDS